MAEDSSNSKVIITLDLDSKSFTTNINGATSELKSLKEEGGGAFDDLSLKALGLNAAVELLEKALEGVHKAAEAIEKADSFTNIESAFTNMAASIGANGGKMMGALKQATAGTVSNLDLMQESMRAIKAGIQADQIPLLAQYAEKISAASGGMHSFSEIMDKVTRAVQSGGGGARGLQDLGITITGTGNRTATLNSILEQMATQVTKTGDNYHELGEKIKAAAANTSVSMWTAAGQAMEHLWTAFGGGDKVDKSVAVLDGLKAQITAIEKAAVSGQKQYEIYADGITKMLPIQQALAIAQDQFAKEKEKLNDLNKEETETTKKLAEALGEGRNKDLALTEQQKKDAEVVAEKMALERQATKELAENGEVSLKTLQDLQKAKAAELQKDAELQKENALSSAHTVTQGAARVLSINQKLYGDLRKLYIDDEAAKRAQEQAELNYLQTNRTQVLNFEQRYIAAKTSQENKAYQDELQKLRFAGLAHDQYLKKLELAERDHEKRLQQIKDSFAEVSVENMQVGFTQALSKMREQATDFSKITESLTTKTNGIMVNGFVEAAKGHGDAMQLMTSQFLEMIGTQMIQSGTYHLLNGIWPVNPAELGQGAALIAAGSALVGAGAANAPSTSSGSSGGGGADFNSGGGYGSTPDSAAPDQMAKKSATVVVNGNLMNSKDTADYLTNLIRENSDRTDFNIVAVGGRPYT